MSVEVRIIGGDRVVANLAALKVEARAMLRRAVIASAIDVQGVARRKLAGEVLRERTHHLHDSVHYALVRDDDAAISAVVGTDVAYAAIHEYGFDGVEQVRAHLRRITMAFGRAISPREIAVGAFSRRMHMPERSYLRSALAERAAATAARIQAAIETTVKAP